MSYVVSMSAQCFPKRKNRQKKLHKANAEADYGIDGKKFSFSQMGNFAWVDVRVSMCAPPIFVMIKWIFTCVDANTFHEESEDR